MDRNFQMETIGTDRVAILGNYSEHINDETLYSGIYIPNGEPCTLTVTYHEYTREIQDYAWKYDDYSVKKEGSKIPAQVQSLINVLGKGKRRRAPKMVLLPPEEMVKTVVFHMIWSKGRKDIADKHFPEDYMGEFLYIWCVEQIDPEDTQKDDDGVLFSERYGRYAKYEPFVNWQDCHFRTESSMKILNGPAVTARTLYFKQSTDNFLTHLSRNPLLRALKRDNRAMYNLCVEREHTGVNQFVYFPMNPFLFQRTDAWLKV